MFERAFSPKSLINKWKHNVFIIRLLHTYTQTHAFSYFTWISFYHNFQEGEWVVKMSLTDFAAITHSFIPLSLLLSAIASALFFGRSSIFFQLTKTSANEFQSNVNTWTEKYIQFTVHPFINYSRPNGHLLFNAFNNVTFCFGSICIFYDYSIICIRSIICRFGCLSQDSSHFTMFHREKKICNLFM